MIDLLPELSASRVLCLSPGLGQFARAAASRWPGASVHCHYLDLYRAEQARAAIGEGQPNLSIGCAADFPEEEVDLAALPFSAGGEAELTRDLMQAARQRLALDGVLLASTDNPRDRWLHAQMQGLFESVTCRRTEQGAVYLARKTQPLRKVRDFSAEFAFRDGGRLIRAFSRPGVFSHRRIDPGARQLMNHMEISEGDNVLDIGCGSGVLSLAAALRAARVRVDAMDSNARAVQCAARGAELNELANVAVQLAVAGEPARPGEYRLVLANPPYYAAFDIARRFLLAGRDALAPGGRIFAVTKSPQWYEENMPPWFGQVRVEPSKGYFIVQGRRR